MNTFSSPDHNCNESEKIKLQRNNHLLPNSLSTYLQRDHYYMYVEIIPLYEIEDEVKVVFLREDSRNSLMLSKINQREKDKPQVS